MTTAKKCTTENRQWKIIPRGLDRGLGVPECNGRVLCIVCSENIVSGILKDVTKMVNYIMAQALNS